MCACVCLCVVPGKVCVVLVLWKKAYCHWGWKPCIPGSEIIATLSLLIQGGARNNGKSHLGTTENCRDSLGVTGLIIELLMSTRGR